MGTTQETTQETGTVSGSAPDEMTARLRARQALPPKGACWYCEKPLDSVRRFCGKACADGFDEEAEYTR